MDQRSISDNIPTFYSIASSRMRCNPSARWGPGTTCEKPKDSELSKEFREKIEKMKAERAKQDSMWTQPPANDKTLPTSK